MASTFSVDEDDVSILSVLDASVSSRRIFRSLTSDVPGITVNYEIRFNKPGLTFDDVSALITSSTEELAQNINKYAYINDALEFAGVEVFPPTVEDVTPDENGSDDDDNNLSPGAVAGIVIGCVVFVGIVAGLSYLYMNRSSNGGNMKIVGVMTK